MSEKLSPTEIQRANRVAGPREEDKSKQERTKKAFEDWQKNMKSKIGGDN